jgi:DNA-binding MarR family transcriptional regulator
MSDTPEAASADDVMMHLLHALYTELATRERTDVAVAELCTRFNITLRDLQRHLDELEEHGLIILGGTAEKGTVALTEQGWALFELPEA